MEPIEFARTLRKNPTDAERRIWQALRRRRFDGYKFRRQVPLGNYVADFMCRERRLIIEVDGAQHLAQAAYDATRDEWLRSQGFSVLRVWDTAVLTELSSVEDTIWAALQREPHPNPPP